MASIRSTEVFTPGAYPSYTYVTRVDDYLENSLSNALATPGQIVSISGPSKAGKTVLVEKVVGKDLLIPISGASLRVPEDVWTRTLEWMGAPESVSETHTKSITAGADATGKGSVGIPLVAKGEASLGAHVAGSLTSATQTQRSRAGLPQIVREIGNSEFVLLLDDFHYMARDLQVEVAKQLKEAVRLGVKIVTAVVTHRGDDVLRANPELRGRIYAIDLKYWNEQELKQIAKNGFDILNASVSDTVVTRFAVESAGSPQLMQSLCLQACFACGLMTQHEGAIPAVLPIAATRLQQILEQTSATTDFRSLVDVLDNGPRTRGQERKLYKCRDGSEGDVYTVLLKAVANDPPQLSFSYEQLLQRTANVCSGEPPVGSSITGTCDQMAKLASDFAKPERIIDWDERTFDLPDPYFMFYLRWSSRVRV